MYQFKSWIIKTITAAMLLTTCCYATAKGSNELALKLIQQKTLPSIVSITVLDNNGNIRRGSGFFVDEAGLFATNFKLIENANRITLHMQEGWLHVVDDVIALSKDNELALLRIDRSDTRALQLATPDQIVKPGTPVIAAGSPQKLSWQVTDGAVTSLNNKDRSGAHLIVFSADSSTGHNGGPLLDQYGRVIGVIATSTDANGQAVMNRAIHVRHLRTLMTRTNALPLTATWTTPPPAIAPPVLPTISSAESTDATATDTEEMADAKPEEAVPNSTDDSHATAAELAEELVATPKALEEQPTAGPVMTSATNSVPLPGPEQSTSPTQATSTIPQSSMRKAQHIGQVKSVVWSSVGGGREAAEICPSYISNLLQQELGIATVSNGKNADASISMGGHTDTGKECNMWGCFDGYRLFMNVEITNYQGRPLFRDYFEVDEDDVNEACEELAEDIIDELEDFLD